MVCTYTKRNFLKIINLYFSVHPEQPLRIKEIYEKHKEFGLLDRVKHVESRKATGHLFSECICIFEFETTNSTQL